MVTGWSNSDRVILASNGSPVSEGMVRSISWGSPSSTPIHMSDHDWLLSNLSSQQRKLMLPESGCRAPAKPRRRQSGCVQRTSSRWHV